MDITLYHQPMIVLRIAQLACIQMISHNNAVDVHLHVTHATVHQQLA